LPGVGGSKPDQQTTQYGLAAAGLADQPKRFTGLDPQRHVVDRAQRDGMALQQAADTHWEMLG
jgi:hypothetical protein